MPPAATPRAMAASSRLVTGALANRCRTSFRCADGLSCGRATGRQRAGWASRVSEGVVMRAGEKISMRRFAAGLVPVWLRGYKRAWLVPDLVAGATLSAVAIPETMGYTSI